MIKVVLDTNILVSATFWKGPPNEITLLAAKQKIICCTTTAIVGEYARILKRDFYQEESQIEEKTRGILSWSQIISPSVKITEIREDPEDDKILEAALEAKADCIVSGDWHLLKLKEFRGIKIMKARQFLEEIKRGVVSPSD